MHDEILLPARVELSEVNGCAYASPGRTRAHNVASAVALYFAFALTGFGIALLGSTLPTMLAHWSLTDRRGGALFFAIFLGSSLGALLSRGVMVHSVPRGAALLVAACCTLAFASGWAVFPVFFVYGLGLGISITSINRLRSQRCVRSRITEMNRLNLAWGLGAFSCPLLANEFLRLADVRTLFIALATAFAVFTAWMLLAERETVIAAEVQSEAARRSGARLPAIVALTTLMATGLESSAGAWIATYADRLRNEFEAPVATATVFWLGLLAARALYSTKLVGNFTEPVLLRFSTAVAAAGCVLLLAAQSQAILLIAGFLIGFGVGPVYPLLLAAVLPRVSGNAIFVAAGLGGTVFPWLTGALSTQAGSLRIGMFVPLAAGMALVACATGVAGALAAVNKGSHPASPLYAHGPADQGSG